ncbi:hypothetical protein A3I27_01605 [Candidatus Giovannonibacteria bacterium RIFCSPLOWO2_02_FULL_43_11b]|uniref:Uncharacterized protein n=1 Tax=Candidatus Giovannonibacteria bacterium RIFCSPHIGHO2_12_FULL_43_15 TaxID=1798341 RepID=A0A1F5WP84_9BACT|nr:MAG: hypothetical protein A2739_01080 [Candidatus Giovannonibacteria bacterium RIFCSPHIGHO2_01_FULL_43_100]OGF66452.1 MAG: hypothetical protein A3B97_03880 [Candidatus Giovannonibacteria bacterium RIFCSPHIGHO2_02_FULL_43_32]OGF77397.1 MAG: hypothetical protein A3F23_03665 [Candidatus Giovannonibacteria bacterium RIFCSPHIGHO2_12_FULL_43_15]OGF78423.1 MAG: hypothetical protein A3A15_03455 [Candidatus Giovannonibacteria bacterium RIFCSPLOWO2_01_FULL_43_60]OGF89782.1 MAG: hypothetical protein A3
MLEKEYFSIGEKRIGSWEAIFLIGIIAGFVGAVIKIESDAIDFSGNEAALAVSFPRSASRSPSEGTEENSVISTVDIEAPEVNVKQISGGYVSAEASDNIGVTQIDIFEDEALKISCFDEAFCAYKPSSGSRGISAKAYDAVGNSGMAEIYVSR